MNLLYGVVGQAATPIATGVEIIEAITVRSDIVTTPTKTVTATFSSIPEPGETIIYVVYREHVNLIGSSSPTTGLTLEGSYSTTIAGLYAQGGCDVYSKTAGASESASREFWYADAATSGFISVRGYRLANANRAAIAVLNRSTQTSISSQIIPSTTFNISEGDMSLVIHTKNNNSISSISDSYITTPTLFNASNVYRARLWEKIHDIPDAAHNATISWLTAGNSVGLMVHVPAAT